MIAATNRDLLEEVKAKQFREDLYYRLCPLTLAIPPLRQRRSEIVPLADRHFGATEQKLSPTTTLLAGGPSEIKRLPMAG